MALTKEQQAQYYASEGSKASPLSPTTWLNQQTNLSTGDLKTGTSQTISTNGSPALGTNALDTQAQVAKIMAQIAETTKALEEAKTQKAALEAQNANGGTTDTDKQGVWQKMMDMISNRQTTQTNQTSTEDIVNSTMAKYGVTPESYTQIQGLIGQLTTYNTQIADLQAKKQAAYDSIAQKPIDARYISQEQAVQDKRWNSEISAVSAQAGVVATTIQLKQGLMQDARTTVGMVIDAMTYDQKQDLADMDWALETYSDLYNIMDKEEKDAWDMARTEKQDELNAENDRLETWKDLILGGYTGITVDMTKEEMFRAIGGQTPNIGGVEETNITNQLNASKGSDGYVNTAKYTELRNTSKMGPDEFDKRYSGMLNPNDATAKPYLKGQTGLLSNDKLSKLRAMGIPDDLGNWIAEQLQAGVPEGEIIAALGDNGQTIFTNYKNIIIYGY